MAIDRSGTYDENSSPLPSGTQFLTQYGDYLDALIDTATLRLANVAGTDTITATAEPFEVPGTGLVSGMKFTLVPAANNTGAVTMDIDSRGAQSVLDADGSALPPDALVAGTRYFLEFDGTNFVIVGQTSGGGGALASRTTYDTTTVWTNNYAANTLIEVELWGAGGGGASLNYFGGGGGGYARRVFLASELPSSATITIPAGATVDTDGGNATFGSVLTAYGGGRGLWVSGGTQAAGGGGGEIEAGTEGAAGSAGGGVTPGGDARTIFGGGAGGDQQTTGSQNGGGAVYGGGGGAGEGQSGGTSAYGGNGGDSGSAGQRPGGGGGYNAVGGAGQCIVTVYGS